MVPGTLRVKEIAQGLRETESGSAPRIQYLRNSQYLMRIKGAQDCNAAKLGKCYSTVVK